MDQREDYADRADSLARFIPALACAAFAVSVKAAGDIQGGYGWCDLVFAVFVTAAVAVAWRAVRRG